MEIYIRGLASGYEPEHVTRLFFQPALLAKRWPARGADAVAVLRGKKRFVCGVRMNGLCGVRTAPLAQDTPPEQAEYEICRLLFLLLCKATGRRPAWGMLTGVRPVRLVHDMRRAGKAQEEIESFFRDKYFADGEKYKLAVRTADNQAPVLALNTPRSYSLYISIPFCPSRCLYCSFVSHSIEKTYKLMDQYIDCLCQEIAHTAEVARKAGLKLRTVYFGGGTPTSITAEQLKRLTDCVAEHFDLSQVWEYTIEAGRPDTITREKLQVIREAGVTRISINPQTFNDDVLRFVGRKHPAQAVVDCYEMARELGFDNINMDIIAGLPTDTLDSFRHTVERLLELAPENITVHTLSVKRSADLSGEKAVDLSSLTGDVTEMVDYAQHRLMENGYEPYYLYRQRNILDNLENTGYCKPGKEGLYNVYIMDETHTILACGAGGVSKLRDPQGEDIKRLFNFKYPYEYINRFEEILQRKDETLAFYQSHPLPETKS